MVFSMKKIGKQVGLTRRPVITVCYLLISARPAGLSPKVLLENRELAQYLRQMDTPLLLKSHIFKKLCHTS